MEIKYHTDHIIPLAYNGTNELPNLQALCVGCHMDKTANEQENGQFVKFHDTESSFNEKVQEIRNSVLSSSYAFVEQLEKTHMDPAKMDCPHRLVRWTLATRDLHIKVCRSKYMIPDLIEDQRTLSFPLQHKAGFRSG